MTITRAELQKILDKHRLWLDGAVAGRRAVLRDADLCGAVLSRADLSRAVVRRAVLSGADLSRAVLRDVDLSGAVLSRAVVRRAVLSGVPRIENIHQSVLAAASATRESLNMNNWHTCETTHCRAGWVVTLAGSDGKNLEDKIGTPAAAALIYFASDPKLERVPDFYCCNEVALNSMREMAEKEKRRGNATEA